MTEEVAIDLKLEQDGDAFRQLAQLKSAVIANRQEQDNLKKAYKDGNITQKEYAAEVVRLEANQKKLNAQYSQTQREVTGLKSPFDKLNDSIKENANSVNVAGVSLSSFANPVTAGIAILGALTSAYAHSTVGAKDLEHAQTALGFAFRNSMNQIAIAISGGGEGGEGGLSKLANILTAAASAIVTGSIAEGGVISSLANKYASINELLAENHRQQVAITGQVETARSEAAQLVTDMNDGTKSVEERIHASSQAIGLLNDAMEKEVGNLEDRKKLLEDQLALDKDDEDVQEALLQVNAQIEGSKRRTAFQIAAIQRAESNILEAEKKKTELAGKQEEIREKKKKDDEIAAKKAKDDKGLADEMKRLAELQKLREENSHAAFAEWWAQQVQIAQDANDEMDRIAVANFEKDKERDIAKVERVKSISAGIVQTLTTALTSSAQAGEQILKSYLIMAVRSLKEFLLVKVVGESFSTWDSIITLGLSGALRAAAMAGIIEGVFAGVESAIAGFDDGGRLRSGMGRPIRRSNGDDQLITAKTGEVILNERQQAALGGDAVFNRLGPQFRRDNVGQTGFAIGGRRVALPDDSVRLMVKAFDRLKVAVVIEDIETKSARRAAVREKAQL